jgi:hypothetical protein
VEPLFLKSEFNYYDKIFTELETDRRYFFTHITTGLWFRKDTPNLLYKGSTKDISNSLNRSRNNIKNIIRKTLLLMFGIFKLLQLILFSRLDKVGNTVFFCSTLGCQGYSKNSTLIGSNKPILLSLKPNIYNVKTLEGFTNLNLISLFTVLFESIQHYRYSPKRDDFKAKLGDIFWGCLITKCLVNFMKSTNVNKVYILGSLNHPACRRISYVCDLFRIKSTLIIPRSVHKLSITNLAGISSSSKGMPSEIFVKNIISLKNLTKRVGHIPIKLLNPKKNIIIKEAQKIVKNSFSNLLIVLGIYTEGNIRLISAITRIVELRHIKFNITIKLHPLDKKKKFYDRYINFQNSGIKVSEGENLTDLIKQSDFCILAPSETFAEILNQEKPIFWYRSLFDTSCYNNIYWAYQFGHIIENEEELEKMLKSSEPRKYLELGLKGIGNRGLLL